MAIRVLQAYLDGETDDVTARQVIAHLNDCCDCGMEAVQYREIKESLARRGRPDAQAVERLRGFGSSLLHTGPGDGAARVPGR
ncbi:zf-HC2 domain-containing protein [Streptomyces sp. NPDC046859]|uniref:anti-sigma factor family protein n=1 Tax=Streptomyces sp. NPDC046859 TaxID=3155734 RepID=UPI0033C005E4